MSNIAKNILITGAGGAIGTSLVEYLLVNTNFHLVLNYFLENEIPKKLTDYRDRVRTVVGDIGNVAVLEKCFCDVDTLIHLASRVNPQVYNGNFVDAYKFGADETMSLLDFIKNTDKPLHVIFPSSGGTVYSEVKNTPHKETDLALGVSPYGIQKLMCENYLHLICTRNKNITCNVLRVANPYGLSLKKERKQGFIDVAIHKIANSELLEIWSPLNTVRDYIYSDDLCEAFIKSIQYRDGFNIFNVGSGCATSLKDILEIFRHVCKREVNYKKIDTDFYYPQYSVLDISKARDILKWSPKLTVKEGIAIGLKHSEELINA